MQNSLRSFLPKSILRPSPKVLYETGRPHRHKGFTLLEIIVTLFVFSFGLLGVVHLQTLAFRSHQQAQYQTIASQLANNMADHLRSNPEISLLPNNPYLKAPAQSLQTCYERTSCTTEQLAYAESWQWHQQIAEQLPGGKGQICQEETPGHDADGYLWSCAPLLNATDTWTIKIGWDKKQNSKQNLSSDTQKRPQLVIVAR